MKKLILAVLAIALLMPFPGAAKQEAGLLITHCPSITQDDSPFIMAASSPCACSRQSNGRIWCTCCCRDGKSYCLDCDRKGKNCLDVKCY